MKIGQAVGAGIVASVAVVLGVAAPSSGLAHPHTASIARVLVTARVDPRERGRPIPQSFLGFSTDWDLVVSRTGDVSVGANTFYDHLVENLAAYGGGIPTLRVGGNYQDSAWWDPSGRVTLRDDELGLYTPITASQLRGLQLNARVTGQHMILGLNLGADRPSLAQAEVRALLAYIPRRKIIALAIGNEPGQYPYHIRFQQTDGSRRVVYYLRSRAFDGSDYIREWRRFAAAIKAVKPGLPLAGTDNFPGLMTPSRFISSTHRQLTVYTQHYYAVSSCSQTGQHYRPGDARYPTLRGLLGKQPFSLIPDIQGAEVSRLYGKPFYLDEFNSTSCGGRVGFSDTLGASLWLLDQYFINAFIRVHGIDLHVDDPTQAPFVLAYAHHRWLGYVTPLYYAMLTFAQAVGSHGRLLLDPAFTARSPEHASVQVFGVRDPDGSLRLIVIDKDLRKGGAARILVPGVIRSGSVISLTGSGPSAIAGVTVGGQSIDSAGELTGRRQAVTVRPVAGVYEFSVAPASVAVLTIPGAKH